MLWLLLACAAPPTDSAEPVVFTTLVEAWAPGQDDPLADHRPEGEDCHASGWGPEGLALEVETDACDYAWLVQPVTRSLGAGAWLEGEMWSGPLDASEPAEAHVAILLEDEVVWEIYLQIPGPPEVHPIAVELDAPIPLDTQLGLHLHNHGDNVWNLGPLTLTGPPGS